MTCSAAGGPADGPQVVLVTGASSGIGRATARLAAGRGAHVVLLARGEGPLREAAAECAAAGAASTLVLTCDVGDDAEVAEAVARAAARYGRIDVVVHSAGVVAYGRTELVPAEVFDGVLRTNLTGAVNLARHVLPGMRERDHGVYVQVGSVIAHLAVPMMSPYVVSKWGVRALVRQLQVENRDRPGVHVCYLAPGGVGTPIYLQAGTYQGHVGRPPPPVVSAEHLARAAFRLVDRPRARVQVPVSNNLLRFGFSALPWLYDPLVRLLFPVGATDLTRRVPDGPGNVLASQPAGNRVDGRQGSALAGVARNLVSLLRDRSR